MHPHQVRFGIVLRRQREAAGRSQEAPAADAGVHRNYVGLLQRGLRMPYLLVVQPLATALGVGLGDLVAEVEREPDPA